jgi:hypothetical protein
MGAAITLIARTRGDPLDEAPAVRERIRAVDQHAFVTDIRSMNQLIAGSQAERRAGTLLTGVFSALALVLAVFGVYTVITQALVQRQSEMGIRSALGAEPRQLVALAMRTALKPATIGVRSAPLERRPSRASCNRFCLVSPHRTRSAGSEPARSCSPLVSSPDTYQHGARRRWIP